MRHYNIEMASSRIGGGIGESGDQAAQNEASSANSAGAGVRDIGCISTESDGEKDAGEVIGGREQSTIVVDQDPDLDELTLDLDNNMQVELSESGVEMGVMENLSEIAPEAVGSAAAKWHQIHCKSWGQFS